MELIELISCDNSVEANVIVSKLESEGIPAFLHNEHFTTLFSNTSPTLGSGIRVMIPKDQLERSRALIISKRSNLSCGFCGSERLREYNIKLNLMKILGRALLSVFFGKEFYTTYKCDNCGLTTKIK